jgi:hypothetical protein
MYDFFTSPHSLELDPAIDDGKQGIIAPLFDIFAGVYARSTLPYQNTASRDGLAVESFHAEILRVRIAAILRAANAFFMSHFLSPDL